MLMWNAFDNGHDGIVQASDFPAGTCACETGWGDVGCNTMLTKLNNSQKIHQKLKAGLWSFYEVEVNTVFRIKMETCCYRTLYNWFWPNNRFNGISLALKLCVSFFVFADIYVWCSESYGLEWNFWLMSTDFECVSMSLAVHIILGCGFER